MFRASCLCVTAFFCLLWEANGAEPSAYILDFPTQDNPLKINVVKPYSKNYIITIGDWGAETTEYKKVQTGVAKKLKAFYAKQKAAGYNLLFVAAVGDNFYWTGQNCQEFQAKWKDMYGNVTSVPWLAIMGNHDWGNSDETAMCAWKKPRFMSPRGIPYAANQLNPDKKGCNPTNYYMPDFGYYYSINELNFEMIGVEQSVHDCPNGIGGDGAGDGAKEVFKLCGGTSIGCGYLEKIANASESMLVQRARYSNNTNFLITQHYPSRGAKLVDKFTGARQRKSDLVWSAYGHVHRQQCDRTISVNGTKVCDAIMTGGGGGCCSELTRRGFFVIGFDDEKRMTQPLAINDPEISCEYPCTSDFTENDETVAKMNEWLHARKHRGL